MEKRFCASCGAENNADQKFCSGCGQPLQTAEEEAVNETLGGAAPEPKAQTWQQQSQQQAPPQPTYIPNYSDKNAYSDVVPTRTFFGLMFLFAIPVVGWVICIIMALGATKNKNKRNFARAILIWLIIAGIIAVAAYFAISWLSNMVLDYVNQMTGGQLEDFKELMEQFKQFENLEGLEGLEGFEGSELLQQQ